MRKLLLSTAALALGTLGVLHPNVARANDASQTVYEASQLYCQDGSTTCQTPAHIGNLRYGEATGVFYSTGVLSGTPLKGVFVCGGNYIDSSGHMHDVGIRAFPGFDEGSISGTVSMPHAYTESSTSAISTFNLHGSDALFHSYFLAVGTQTTNNVTDAPVSGGITILMWGPLVDTNDYTNTSTVGKYSFLVCKTGSLTSVLDSDSEAVISDSDGD